jgi:hypothetical protein
MQTVGLVVLLIVFCVVIFLKRRELPEDRELQRLVDTTIVINEPRDLMDMGYGFLNINILNEGVRTSFTPRPGAVIRDFKLKGFDVAICPIAWDKWGKKRVYYCSSLWGKKSNGEI